MAWSWVVERFSSERNFWIGTVTPDGSPMARPVWGVMVDETICFGGGPKTRWSQNLERDPRASVHLESGTEVVIAEGAVDRLTDASDPRLPAIDDAYEVKYEMRHGPPIWLLQPSLVLAWRSFPKDMTRFRFPPERSCGEEGSSTSELHSSWGTPWFTIQPTPNLSLRLPK